jgi:PAS domain S-box-containing protein
MTKATAMRVKRFSPWAGLGVLVVLLFIGALGLLELQLERMLEDYDEHAQDDIELIGFLVHDALQQQDYDRIDSLLKEWGKRRMHTHGIRLTTANGFVLGEFRRQEPARDALYLSKKIPYSYKGLATLELIKDRRTVHAGLERLRLELILGALVIGLVLWRLVTLSMRQREKAEALRVQTEKLDRANARLQDVADEIYHMRSYLKNILDSMPSILVGVNDMGCVTQWNISAEKATNMAADEAMGRHFVDLFPWAKSLAGGLLEAMRTGRPVHAERMVTREDDELRYSDVMIYPLVASGTHGVVVRVDDITERVQIEQMMVQTEKMMTVGGLAAGMAHEINNPLSGVLQSCQNILRRLSPELEANQAVARSLDLDLRRMGRFLEERGILGFLAAIRDAAERASRIVADMLSFSRRGTREFEPVSAVDMLEGVVRLASSDYDLKKKYDFKRIDIVREYDPNLGPVPCDHTEIEQVLLNLIKNAAQAMFGYGAQRPARIVLRTAKVDGFARIEVEDNGPGMEEQTLQRVFEPFFTTKPPGVGTGLGLSVSYFIVAEQHKGTFSVNSTPGQGTCFVIRLPLNIRP